MRRILTYALALLPFVLLFVLFGMTKCWKAATVLVGSMAFILAVFTGICLLMGGKS